MDLHPIPTPPSPDELAAVASVLDGEGAAGRHLLLPVLHALQARVGWISPGGLGLACTRLQIPPAEAYGVASFYSLFSTSPRPATVVHVCEDVACALNGAERLCGAAEARLGPAGTERNGAMWQRSPCLGLCEQAPAAMVTTTGIAPSTSTWGHAIGDDLVAAAQTGLAPERRADAQPRAILNLLRRVGRVDPGSLGAYRASGGYEALRRALEIGPNAVIREVTEAKLMGRGGAAFPTGRKWQAVAAQPVRPHWLVCNADESEPGTFKDRVLMEGDPFRLVEAMTIAAIATGCDHGILYIRGEYPLAMKRLKHAMAEARTHGFLGPDILGRGVGVELSIRQGAGAYICGEETALFASIEGFRGEPRAKPPFPVEVGLFGKPTLINNVETLCNVPDIVMDGGAAFAALGTAQSTGSRLFCLSGHVERPGLYEVISGMTLRALIELAGGVAGGRSLRAVLLGGAAGTFLRPEELDVALTFEDTRRVGATLGSGVVVLFDDQTPLLPHLQRIAGFFRDESCGQCVPCRVGTVRQEELLARLANRRPHGSVAQEKGLFSDLDQCMRDASICGLGQTASSAIDSAMKRFPELWEGA